MLKDYLSKEERFMCIKAGALSYAGVRDAEDGTTVLSKSAGSAIGDGVSAAKSLAVLAALTTGVPIGIFAHVMGRRIAGKRLREEELKEKIRIYRSASDELASGLSEGV